MQVLYIVLYCIVHMQVLYCTHRQYKSQTYDTINCILNWPSRMTAWCYFAGGGEIGVKYLARRHSQTNRFRTYQYVNIFSIISMSQMHQ